MMMLTQLVNRIIYATLTGQML